MNKGICVAGNMLVDVLYPISGYPKLGELTTIQEGITKSTGGALCNVALDLARLDASLPIKAVGMAGQDEEGAFILSALSAYSNIDCSRIRREGTTSFTAVMHDVSTNQRSFFHSRGGNAKLNEDCFNWDTLSCDILHIGYLLLLDALDAPDGTYGTKMARLLCHAKERGILTSVDVVSESGTRYQTIVPPALKYTDFCIINELEAQYTTGVPLREGGVLLAKNMPRALTALKDMGVSRWAVIHAQEGAWGMDEAGRLQEA
ncbi:MAG: carbohydrate kinase family protein, partial [Eubacteriales bacterium]|nr:carbohydrate kinase family protein [Eubacteriales bacterium]